LEGRLVEAYRHLDPNGTALHLDETGSGARLDLDAPLVRGHRCEAVRALAAVFDDAALPAPAARLRTEAGALCAPPAPS
jgi:hypothetical protein